MRSKLSIVTFISTVLIGAGDYRPTRYGYTVPLAGREEANFGRASGVAGDPDAFGFATLTVNPGKRQLCYHLALANVSTPLMAYVHEGPRLRNGPPRVTLFTGPGGELDNCIAWTRSQLAEIVANPSNYYVDVATTEFPDGALRGQMH